MPADTVYGERRYAPLIHRARMACLVLIFSVVLASGVRAQTIGPRLQEALATAGPLAQLEIIVTFDQDGALTLPQRLSLQRLGLTGVYFESLPMAGVVATPAQIQAIAGLNGVRSIWSNDVIAYETDDATTITGVDALRNDADLQAMNGGLPFSGRGVGVLVNDSGVDATHDDLKNQVVQNVAGQASLNNEVGLLPYLYVEDVPHTDVGGGHGTHVAGIVAANGAKSGGLYEGVAPGVDLIGYGAGATVALLDVIGAFDYALTHQFTYNIRVVTNSWGNTGDAGTDFNPDDPTNVATKRLADRGIVVVFSAGNSGPDDDTISGNFKKAPWVITVAAGNDDGLLADFSSRGKAKHGGTVVIDGQAFTWEDRPTVTAPGVHIASTRATGGLINGAAFDPEGELLIAPAHLPYYTSLNGTSMACPHVAGIVALMLEANPQLDVYAIKDILQATATKMTGRALHEAGAGYVNAYAAVAVALDLDAAPYLFDPFDPASSRLVTAGAFDTHPLDGTSETPQHAQLDANYPNPFNPSTQITFTLAESGPARLVVYNLLGQQLHVLLDGQLPSGRHTVRFEAGDLASGTYLYRLETPGGVITRRMVLVK